MSVYFGELLVKHSESVLGGQSNIKIVAREHLINIMLDLLPQGQRNMFEILVGHTIGSRSAGCSHDLQDDQAYQEQASYHFCHVLEQ